MCACDKHINKNTMQISICANGMNLNVYALQAIA